jgi:hypothetical protein
MIPCLMLMCRTCIALPDLLKITSGFSVCMVAVCNENKFYFGLFSSTTVREFVREKNSPFFAR